MKPFKQPYRQRDVDGGVQQDHPELGVAESEMAEHQIDRDRDRDRRHHPRRQDEEQQSRPRAARGSARMHRPRWCRRHTARKVEPKPMIIEFRKRGTDLRRPADHHVARAHQPLVPGLRRRQAGHEFRRLPRARREQVDVAFDRRLEQDLGRIGDRDPAAS